MGKADCRKKLVESRGFEKRYAAYCVLGKGKTFLGNFGIFCGVSGYLVDSASTPEKAQEFCEYINDRLRSHPLWKPTPASWRRWIHKYQEWTPDANMGESDLASLLRDGLASVDQMLLFSESPGANEIDVR